MKRTPLKRKTRLKAVSDKRRKLLRRYTLLRKLHLSEHRICQVNGCASLATDIHHTEGRGIKFLRQDTFLAVCRPHHEQIHGAPNAARQAGLLK